MMCIIFDKIKLLATATLPIGVMSLTIWEGIIFFIAFILLLILRFAIFSISRMLNSIPRAIKLGIQSNRFHGRIFDLSLFCCPFLLLSI